MNIIELEPPPSAHLTTSWQPMSAAVEDWVSVLWIILAPEVANLRQPVSVAGVTAQAWKTYGKGKVRGIFLHLHSAHARVLVNMTTKQIRLNP